MAIQNSKDKASRKKLILKLIGLTIYLALFLYFYYLLVYFGLNPLIVTILFIFIILTTIGPFFRRNKKGLYSKMFSKVKKGANLSQKRKIDTEKLQKPESKIFKPINLQFEYRKPLINKCKNCGNIVPNFVKKCPFCNKNIIQ
ncbi:MAG: hypothetical protein ACFE75_04350 [Candidatus Hodarchaeota archaeon]